MKESLCLVALIQQLLHSIELKGLQMCIIIGNEELPSLHSMFSQFQGHTSNSMSVKKQRQTNDQNQCYWKTDLMANNY